MKKHVRRSSLSAGGILKLSRSLSWALLAIMALQAPGSAIAMEQEQPLSQRKQSLLRRLVANYKETRELHRKRKAGKASPEELKKLEERMKKIKKAAIKAGVIAAFIAAIFGAKWAYGKYLFKKTEIEEWPVKKTEIEEWPDIHRAAFEGNLHALEQLLLAPEADIETGNDWFSLHSKLYGETLLHLAVKGNKSRAVQFLLQHGANIEAQDRRDYTPLVQATIQGNIEIVRLLLSFGANVNAQYYTYETYTLTPLHVAALNGYPDIVQLLLKYGADPLLFSKSHGTPLDPVLPAGARVPPQLNPRRADKIRDMIQDAISKRTLHAIWVFQKAGLEATGQPVPQEAIRSLIKAERGQSIEQEGVPLSERPTE